MRKLLFWLTLVIPIIIAGIVFVSLYKPSKAAGASYYVSPSGLNTNPGSEAEPWQTVQYAVDHITPGDTIYLRTGTYNESVNITITGTSGNPITLRNYASETPIIDGGSNIALRSSGTSYWVIDGIEFHSTNRYTLRIGWWSETPTTYWTVQNNHIYGPSYIVGSYHLWEGNNIDGTGYTGTQGDGGINDGDSSHHNTYRGNTIHDFTNDGARGIWCQHFPSHMTIEDNTITNINPPSMGQCIDLDGAATVTWSNVVRNNTVSGCNYVGIQLENTFNTIVENNTVNADTAGIIVINYDSVVDCDVDTELGIYGDVNGDNNCEGDDTDNIIRQNVIWTSTYWGWGYGGLVNWYAGGVSVWGNTIYAPGSSGNAAINSQGSATENALMSIKSNILANGNGAALCALDFDAFTVDNDNLMYKTNNEIVYGTGSDCSPTYTIAQYQAATGLGANSLFGAINFVNAGSQDFHLQSTSPARNTGVDVGTTTDRDGLTRPMGTEYDMGAYEYSEGGTPTPTPTATPTATSTPTSSSQTSSSTTPPSTCDIYCVSNSDCQSDLVCSAFRCRHPDCTGESDCICTKTCNQTCGNNVDCLVGLSCVAGYCRNLSCSTDTDCLCGSGVGGTNIENSETLELPASGMPAPTVIGLVFGGLLIIVSFLLFKI